MGCRPLSAPTNRALRSGDGVGGVQVRTGTRVVAPERVTTWEATGRAAQALEDVSDGVIVLDRDWVIVYANAKAARFVSKAKAEMVGLSFWTAFPEAYDHEFGILYRKAMETQEAHHLEAYYGLLQGWFDVRVIPTLDGLTLFFSQVNERRKAEDTQRALVARLESALTRQSQTQTVVVALAEAMSVDDVASIVLDLSAATLGSSVARLALLNESRSHLELVGGDHEEPAISTDVVSALTDCVRLRQAVFYSSREDAMSSYPGLADELALGATSASASVPLIAGGRAIGALAMRWRDEREFSDQDRAFLRMLASQAALAVERTTLIGRQRNVAETLQQSMLPDDMPTVDGVDVSACYLPATTDMRVGGDWYDAFLIPDGRIVFAVGDVSGHGVEAAAVMGQVRNSLRAYMIDVEEPAAALVKLDELVARSGHGLYATVIVGVYDPTSGALVWSNAGHPPLALCSASGTRFLAMTKGVPIGIGHSFGHVEERITLQAGETIIGYTDGLIERRGEDIDAGMARLAASISETADRIRSGDWCADLVEHAVGLEHRDDDICVLALHRI